MNNIVSAATKRNWVKLDTSAVGRLTSRANKCMSKKRFIPVEYFTNCNNINTIQSALLKLYDCGLKTRDIILSLGYYLLDKKGITCKNHVEYALKEYSFKYVDKVSEIKWPEDERDLLGIIYQSLLFEGDKNQMGSYFTPESVVRNMTSKLDFSKGQIFFDPCCGSGSFLISLDSAAPEQIFGMDIDPIAVYIARVNLLLKYSEYEFIPQIECANYIDKSDIFSLDSKIKFKQFDYIMTNPPWGAISKYNVNIPEIVSKETFSYFFINAFGQLRNNGVIRFLLPESVLNVKVHKDIRSFMLSKCCIDSITLYDDSFSGVTTKYIDIACSKCSRTECTTVYKGSESRIIPIKHFYETENLIFNFLTEEDISIVHAVKSIGEYNLSDSIWALGIVTGDNKNKLFSEQKIGMEPIYTGKEIMPYTLNEAKKYLYYDRSKFQQVAKEEFYRADEKLVYKFISNKLTFAYDNKQRLFLNSANILIPKIPNMSIKTVMAFLNSELYQFLYIQMFGEVKILKGNLNELPFPKLTIEQDKIISELVESVIIGRGSEEYLQQCIYNIFGISKEQIKYIRRFLHGTTS